MRASRLDATITDPDPRRLTLGELVAAVPGAQVLRGAGLSVDSIAYDSRKAEPGGLFVALRGAYADGHDYLEAAAERGAPACLIDQDPALYDLERFEAICVVDDSRAALATVASHFFDHPSRSLTLVGITGTDGKTTTSFMLDHLLAVAGQSVGLIGTILTKVPGMTARSSGRQTTPESLDTQRLLSQMRSHGADTVILETSSHGLETHRVDGCCFDVGVVTNITHEHLDFHGSVDAYRRAKARLLDYVTVAVRSGGRGIAVLNLDDEGARTVQPFAAELELVTYGLDAAGTADVRATDIQALAGGYGFMLTTPQGAIQTAIPMIGNWNVSNALAATAIATALGLDLVQIDRGLRTLPAVPGRMEFLEHGQSFRVLVDYAHTAPALSLLLDAAREVTRGRVLVLFGSAGERDLEKRAEMGRIATQLADYVVITSEDPRFEDPQAIIDEIARGAIQSGAIDGVDFVRLEDRAGAIRHILEVAGDDDMVILAGKGHESSMIYGSDERPWDEKMVARNVLQTLGYRTT